MSKVLFLDLDGTFLRNANLDSYSKKDLDALVEFQKNKNFLIVNTGRSYKQAKVVWDKLYVNEYSRFLSCANGAEIYNNNKLISKNYIKKSEILEVFNYLKSFSKIGFKLPNDKYYYSSYKKRASLVEWFTNLKRKEIEKFNLEKNEYSKFGVILLSKKNKNIKLYKDLINKFPNLNLFLTGHDHYIEIVSKNVSKGKVVDYFLSMLNIDYKNSISAGDSGNDLEMFKKTYHRIMMSNTPKRIVSEVRLLEGNNIKTRNVKKNGVSKAIDKI